MDQIFSAFLAVNTTEAVAVSTETTIKHAVQNCCLVNDRYQDRRMRSKSMDSKTKSDKAVENTNNSVLTVSIRTGQTQSPSPARTNLSNHGACTERGLTQCGDMKPNVGNKNTISSSQGFNLPSDGNTTYRKDFHDSKLLSFDEATHTSSDKSECDRNTSKNCNSRRKRGRSLPKQAQKKETSYSCTSKQVKPHIERSQNPAAINHSSRAYQIDKAGHCSLEYAEEFELPCVEGLEELDAFILEELYIEMYECLNQG